MNSLGILAFLDEKKNRRREGKKRKDFLTQAPASFNQLRCVLQTFPSLYHPLSKESGEEKEDEE